MALEKWAASGGSGQSNTTQLRRSCTFNFQPYCGTWGACTWFRMVRNTWISNVGSIMANTPTNSLKGPLFYILLGSGTLNVQVWAISTGWDSVCGARQEVQWASHVA